MHSFEQSNRRRRKQQRENERRFKAFVGFVAKIIAGCGAIALLAMTLLINTSNPDMAALSFSAMWCAGGGVLLFVLIGGWVVVDWISSD
ncbi:MAG: hypothetical protein KC419_17145 [Anaerolineales bacterium]|nr:hypothetical protein [Anaerolineales bacterium]